MPVLLLPLLSALLIASPARSAPESYEQGLRALSLLAQGRGNEVSRSYFRLESPAKNGAGWGKPVEGDEKETGIDVPEAQAKIDEARRIPGAAFRFCNFHTHRKGAVLRLQKERHELPRLGNRSFPPSGADTQISLVGPETWREWNLDGESAMGVVDSLGVWMYRELSDRDDDPARLALIRKFAFTDAEIAAAKSSGIDASEQGRYEYMKAVNARELLAEDIPRQAAYRQLVLRYAVLENVELAFLPLETAVRTEPCRGF